MMIIMNKCLACEIETNQKQWCSICEILIPIITNHSLETIPNKKNSESLREILDYPAPNIRDVWKSLNNIDRSERSWFMNDKNIKFKRRLFDWNENYNVISTIFSDEDGEVFSNNTTDVDILRKLQRGGVLPDGSHISWASNKFFLDGEIVNLPYRDMIEILSKKEEKKEYDWKAMIFLLSLATSNKPVEITRKRFLHGTNERWNKRFQCKHPVNILDIGNNKRIYESIKEITSQELHEDTNYWINSWNRVLSDKTRVYPRRYTVPISLIIDRGKLMLRVRRDDKWKKIRVPRSLEIWSILINWCLMLPGNKKRNHLESLQHYLFCDSDIKIISDAEKNGFNFLRGIIDNSNGRARIDDKKRILVEGKYGVNYTILPGAGAHGSRFKVLTDIVTDSDRMQDEIFRRLNRRFPDFGGLSSQRNRQKELCIVEEPHLRQLVIGDAIGSIVMALLNDDESRKKIDTLDKHLSQFVKKDSNNNDREIIDLENRAEIDRILQRIEHEEYMIQRLQERIHGDYNERRLAVLRNQLEVLQESLRRLQRDFDDMH
ncbi:hypothetical protein OAO74_02150 [Euryarchaeota archaeon]|nr:hypothetical protein [Euryarchaeota archaeon]